MGWLAVKALGLPRYLWLVIAVALAVLVYVMLVRLEVADDTANQEIGRTTERVEALEETVTRVEEADDVREAVQADVRAGGSERLYAQCLRSARAPENCQRFLPR